MDQIKKFYITSFLKNQTFFTPILIIFLQAQHLNYSEIFWVFTIGSIFSIILELPTGIIADLYGKRKSIIIAKFGIFISYVVFGLSSTFLGFVIAQLVLEFGNSFRSGTESAYVYDYVTSKKISYTEVKGKQKFWARVGGAIAAALGGLIAAAIGFREVFFLSAGFAFINFLVSLTWEKIEEANHASPIRHMNESFRLIFKNLDLVRIVLNITLFTSVLAALSKFIQPYLVDVGVPIAWFGLIYAGSLALAAIAVRYSYLVENKLGKIRTINILSLIAILPAFIIGLKFISILGIFLFVSVVVIENIRSPIANNEFHSRVPSKKRATMGSILELFKSAGKITILPFAGYFADAFSIYTATMILAVILALNGIFFYVRYSADLKSI